MYDIWFAEDVVRILGAVNEANLDMRIRVSGGLSVRMYGAGWDAAMSSIATAFGLSWQEIVKEEGSQLYIPQGKRLCLPIVQGEEA